MAHNMDSLSVRVVLRRGGIYRIRATAMVNGVPIALGTRDVKTADVLLRILIPFYRYLSTQMKWRLDLSIPYTDDFTRMKHAEDIRVQGL